MVKILYIKSTSPLMRTYMPPGVDGQHLAAIVRFSLEQTPRRCLALVSNLGRKHIYEWPQSCTTQMLIDVNGVRVYASETNNFFIAGGSRFFPSTVYTAPTMAEADLLSQLSIQAWTMLRAAAGIWRARMVIVSAPGRRCGPQ